MSSSASVRSSHPSVGSRGQAATAGNPAGVGGPHPGDMIAADVVTFERPDPTSETSLTLLHRVQNPVIDDEAWDTLVDLYGTIVYDWLRSFRVQECDAADVMQEVFRKVARSVGRFERRRNGSFRAWLWTITRRELYRFFTTHRHKPSSIGGSDAHAIMHAVVDTHAADPVSDSLVIEGLLIDQHAEPDPESTAAQVVANALKLIRPDFSDPVWESFWRMMVLQQSPAEIAADQKTTEGNVRQRKYRVLNRLKALLRGMEVFPDDDELAAE